MVDIRQITPDEAKRILALEETHYVDLKGIDVEPAKLTETVSAFANASGGELFVGIEERAVDGNKERSWRGFADAEAANGHLAAIEAMSALGDHYRAQFLRTPDHAGLVLHLTIFKTKQILNATGGTPYRRVSAQKQPVKGDEALKRLRLDKGIVSFENETVGVAIDTIANSQTIIGFMLDVVPTAEPEDWLRKQNLIMDDKPTVAGLLLFADEPQASLPKRSAIKIYRYKTKEGIGTRDTLAFDPITIEGSIYSQIKAAVKATKDLVEGMKRLGEKGLEEVIYPDETLHEIITNAALHRDYSIVADVHVRIYDNRIEVESPGRLPGHVTVANILNEQSARNPQVVRLINKFPDPPNKDVGEGLNTAFEAMKKLRLKEPAIEEREHSVIVNIKHAPSTSSKVRTAMTPFCRPPYFWQLIRLSNLTSRTTR